MDTNLLLVAVGGFMGAIARYTVSIWVGRRNKTRYPIGTLIINLLGSFLLGMIIGSQATSFTALLWGTGFMGAFTTFSTFKVESMQLWLKRERKVFVNYVLLSYLAGVMMAGVGFSVGAMIS